MTAHDETPSIAPIASSILHALMCLGVGHTHVMRTGTDANDCIVIAHNAAYAKQIAGRKGISLHECNTKLQGLRKAVAIDNFALEKLLHGLLSELSEARAALQSIIDGDPAGATYSGSQCVEIADAALRKGKTP